MPISFAQLAASPAGLSPEEAAALALAAARRIAPDTLGALPGSNDILLDGDGAVWFGEGYAPAAEPDHESWLAARTRELLGIDGATSRDGHVPIPGGLLLLLARASGQIDLHPPSFATLIEGLRRFASEDPLVLRSIYQAHTAEAASAPDPVLDWDYPAAAAAVIVAPPRTARARMMAAAAGGVAAGIGLGFILFSGVYADVAHALDAVLTLPAVSPRTGSAAPAPVVPVPRPAVPPPAAPASGVTASSDGAAAVADPVAVAAAPGERPRVAPVLSDNAFSPSFAAGGRELLFHAGRERAVLMRGSLDASGVVSRLTPLARMSGADYHVTPSPDGQRLAFDSDREGVRGVYVARADGSEARRISGEGYAAIPTWSPDGRQLAFVRAEPDQPRVWNIWLASLADGSLRRFTQHQRGQPWGASWFPDGQRVAYSLETTLVIASLGEAASITVPSPRRGRLVRTPAVSPDGTHVIFQVFGDGAWLFDVRSGQLRRVLDDPTAEEFAWSPDGRRVAFHAQRNGAWSLWQAAINPARDAAAPPTPLLPGSGS